jgi:hypothetical protein
MTCLLTLQQSKNAPKVTLEPEATLVRLPRGRRLRITSCRNKVSPFPPGRRKQPLLNSSGLGHRPTSFSPGSSHGLSRAVHKELEPQPQRAALASVAPPGGSRGLANREGIVSKRLGSRYRSGRSKDWLKMKNSNAPAVKTGRRGGLVKGVPRGPSLVSVNLILYPLSQFRNGSRAPAIPTRYARRSTLFWIFPDIAPSFSKRTPPASPPAKLPTDQTSHKARMRFPWK